MPVIVISGMPGAGSSTTSELLAKKLGLRLFSMGRQLKAEEEKSSEAAAVKSYWEERGKSASHNRAVDDMVVREARKGNVVIDAKLGIHFLRDIAHFKVWLDCPLAFRARRYMQRDRISEQEAIGIIKETEASWQKHWKKIYGINPFDQEFEADMVIDTSRKHPEEIVREIIERMEKLGISVRGHAKR